MHWTPIDINLWNQGDWYISRNGESCFWISAPDGKEFGPFASFQDADSAVESMQASK